MKQGRLCVCSDGGMSIMSLNKELITSVDLNGGFVRTIAEDKETIALVSSLGCFVICATDLRVISNANNILQNSGGIEFEVSCALILNSMIVIAKGNIIYVYSICKNEVISSFTLEFTSMITSLCKSNSSNSILVGCMPNIVANLEVSQNMKLSLKGKYETKHINEIYGIKQSNLPGLYLISGNVHEEKKTLSTLCYYIENSYN